MSEPAVQFAEVDYRLPNGRELLRTVSFSIASGTTTALLGRSGSGKTTLLRMVNGLVMPTSGRVLVRGQITRDHSIVPLRRSIGYVIQETGLFPHMTVERNVALSLELAEVPRAERIRPVAEALALVGLNVAEFGPRYPWQLSGGQRQRVGLARALVSGPDVLLMDEPFGALDPLTRAEMQMMLRNLLKQVRKTVLLVTHDLAEALFLANRVIFLEAGEVVADLATTEVMESENPHVRAYTEAAQRTAPNLQ